VEKYGTARQATDDNTSQAHCTPDNKGYKHTYSVMKSFLLFHCNNGCTKAPQYYVTGTLPISFLPFYPTIE